MSPVAVSYSLPSHLRPQGNLDRRSQWHLADPQRCPCVAAPIAEDFQQQVRGTVENLWLAPVTGGRVRVALETNDLHNAIQVSHRFLQLGQGIDHCVPRRLVPLLISQFRTNPPGVAQFAIDPWQLAAGDNQ